MLERRAFGTEMEYGASSRPANNPYAPQTDLSASEIDHVFRNYLPNSIVRIGTMASNGARIYTDHFHPEYATPETTSIRELLAIELGSEEIVRDAFEAWEEASGRGRVISINKRVMSDTEAWGYHSNFQIDRRAIGKYSQPDLLRHHPAFKMLGLHLASANVFVGAGGIYGNAVTGYRFVTAQKAMFVKHDFHADTVNYKPVVNLRDEPHADRGQFGRLHITSQDANISPWALLMKWGMSALVIGCMEERIFPDWQFELKEGMLHMLGQHVAQDVTCKRPFVFGDGRPITVLEIQEEIYNAARKLSHRVQLSEELLWVLDEWGRAIADARISPDRLEDRSDWVLRQRILGRKLLEYTEPDEKGRTGYAHSRVRAFDLSFDRLTTRGGAGQSVPDKLRAKKWQAYMPNRATIETYKTEAPINTRAHPRSIFVRQFHKHDDAQGNASAIWDKGIVTTRGVRAVIDMPDDPRETAVPLLDVLLHAVADPDNMTPEVVAQLRAKDAATTVPRVDEWSL